MADPALDSTTELETQERFHAGDVGFIVNWPYIWEIRNGATWDASDLGWASFPRTSPGHSARPPVGGVALTIPASSEHRQLALEAARCITSAEHQVDYVVSQSYLSGLVAVYDDPRVRQKFPMADLLREGLNSGAPRPNVANYDEVSQALLDSYWPPSQVDPRSTPRAAQKAVDAAMP